MNLWQISEERFEPGILNSQETVYTVGNGYFGTRGTFEEGYPGANPATLLFGVFDHIAVGKEELANVPDWLPIKLFVNGERFRLDRGKLLEYQRTLDMQNAVLSRVVRWESPKGARIKVTSERFASLTNEHVGVIRYSVTAEGWAPESEHAEEDMGIVLWASLNTAVGNYDLMHWESVDQGNEGGKLLWLQTQTRHSLVQMVQTMSFKTQTKDFLEELIDSDNAPSIRLYGTLGIGDTITTDKIVVMYTSHDTPDPFAAALKLHNEILAGDEITDEPVNYDVLLAQHAQAWHRYWQTSDIIIEGDDRAQQAIRYNIYQLRISASDHDSRYSVAAKGLTGFGYRGHIFHDTEIFMLPYYIYVHPDIARCLLLYRYHLLPAARAKAASNGYVGAQYPWESTLNGEETTPLAIIHPESGELIPVLNGSLEIHISASVAHGAWEYWYVTGDNDFMRDYGAEIVLSTAEFWANRATYNADHHDYEINNVIGPDEWHEHVDNNTFTNYMARWNIQTALDILDWLKMTFPNKVQELISRLDLTSEHLDHWRDVAAHIRIPQDKQTGLIEQFDGFFKLDHLDQEKYKGRTASYQGIFGLKNTQHYQIIKQADVLMLLTVLDRQFDLKTKRVNWDYYYPITDHDYGSSLTPAFHVILACQLGLTDIAYTLFMKGALVDLENLRGNTPEGIHDACCGAVWQAAVLGFAGLCLTDDVYTTKPTWPEGWTRLAFNFQHKGQLCSVDLRKS